VKTVIFSELPKADKMKYFKFLIENDINFTRDENGYYVALVKVLNPNFYGGELKNAKESNTKLNKSKFEDVANISQQDEPMDAKPRSSSQVNKKHAISNRFNKNDPRSKSPIGGLKTEKVEKKVIIPLTS
jgi:hypothetical protein